MDRGLTHELTIGLGSGGEALRDAVAAWLEARGVAFAESSMGEEALLVYATERAALVALERALAEAFDGALAFRHVALPDDAWQGAWDASFERMVTEKLVVGRRERIGDAGARDVVVLNPGTAFGQGDHATTEACLRAVEAEACRGAMLDVGTGNGVLAIAAARLGFAPVLGTDLDEEILAEARANAALNGVDARFRCTDAVPEGRYALVTANIPAPALHPLMPQLAAAVAPGGALVLAGFVDKEAEALVEVAARHGLTEAARRAVRGWTGLTLRAPGSPAR